MEYYGDKSLLSEDALSCIEKVEETIKLLKTDFHSYYKYPIPLEGGDIVSIPCLIISKYGIFVFVESNEDKINFGKSCMKHIYSNTSLGNKMFSGIEIIRYFDKKTTNSFINLENPSCVLNKDEIDYFESKIQGTNAIQSTDTREIKKETSLGSLIKKRSEQISTFSFAQSNYITNLDTGIYYRIRGLAGSGKTIIMVKKMAFLHYKYPNMKLAFVFYTISLKQYIVKLFIESYKEYSSNDPNFENLYFLHGWGSNTNPGFYSMFCETADVECEPYDKYDYHRSSFNSVCERALNSYKYSQLSLFDYVFIDEAQDFPKSFFKLVKMALKPTGAFSYAYDELQTLSYSIMPKRSEVFEGVENPKDINLQNCYRTPKQILVTAHALGMAIYCNDSNILGPINVPEDTDIWKATGYLSDPKNNYYGNKVTFFRSSDFTIDYIPDDPVTICQFSNEQEQYKKTYEEICDLLHKEDVTVDDILIIDLKPADKEIDFLNFRAFCYERLNKRKNEEGNRLFDLHLLNQNDRLKFRRKNSIPYTSIFRAKGNESNIVFILNAESMKSLRTQARNMLFTAMTRAKFKVYVFGLSGVEEIIKEASIVKEKDYKLEFQYPTKDELKNMIKIARKEEEEITEIIKGIDVMSKYKKAESFDGLYEMFKNVFGEEKAKQMIEVIQNEKQEK